MLKETRKEAGSDEETVEIDLQIDAYIPSYIQDERQKSRCINGFARLDSGIAYEELLDDLSTASGTPTKWA